MSTGGGDDAKEAARISTELADRSKAIGLPALKGGLGYTTEMLNRPSALPQYAQDAYRLANTTATETGAARAKTARAQLIGGLRAAGGGGPHLADYSRVATGTSQDLAQEVGSIGASKATADIAQHNNLLRLLTGGGASALDLSAGFGGQNAQALGVLGPDPGAYPYIVGGLSSITGALGRYLEPKNTLGSSGWSSVG